MPQAESHPLLIGTLADPADENAVAEVRFRDAFLSRSRGMRVKNLK